MKLEGKQCQVIDCKNHVMEGDFGLEGHQYGYCQIHKINGTFEEKELELAYELEKEVSEVSKIL